MASLWQDVRFGALMLCKAPSFLALSAVTLALGIGANTAIFSVVNGVLLRALPFREPDQLFSLYWRARASPTESVPYLNFLDWQRYNHTFQSLGSYRDDDFNCLGSGDPERLHGKMISAGFFEVLGISPRLGRTFLTEEDALGARPVVVISSSFWQRHFWGCRERSEPQRYAQRAGP